MDLEAAREFVREHHSAVLATYRSDGRPQMSPVAAGVDAEGKIVVSSREGAYKVRNARRDPRVSVLVTGGGWDWVQVDGRASVLSLPEAMEPLVEYYRAVSGEHSDWDDYRAAMEREQRVLICVEVERAGPDRSG